LVTNKKANIGIGLPFWQMLVVMMVFALVAVGISLVIVAFASSSSAANSFTNLIITPTCLLAGCFFPIDMMPKTLQKIADFMPQRWVLDIITKLQQGTSFESLYLNIMILLAFAIAFFLLAIYKFSRNNSVKNYI
jgi:ABC-2 type transport system permease protein